MDIAPQLNISIFPEGELLSIDDPSFMSMADGFASNDLSRIIFSHLGFEDLKSSSLVCKRWHLLVLEGTNVRQKSLIDVFLATLHTDGMLGQTGFAELKSIERQSANNMSDIRQGPLRSAVLGKVTCEMPEELARLTGNTRLPITWENVPELVRLRNEVQGLVQLDNVAEQERVISELVSGYIARGELAEALVLLKAEVLETIDSALTILRFCRELIKVRQYASAVSLSERLTVEMLIAEVCSSLIDAGEYNTAVSLSERLTEEEKIYYVCEWLIDAGEYASAVILSERLADEATISSVCWDLIHAGEYASAVEMSERITDVSEIFRFCRGLIDAGEYSSVVQMSERLTIEDFRNSIRRALVDKGQLEEASQVRG